MAYFKDSKSKEPSLIILDDKHDSDHEGTPLHARPPMIGSFAKKWGTSTNPKNLREWSKESIDESNNSSKIIVLSNSHHKEGTCSRPLPLLGQKVHANESRWDSSFKVNGEFSYVPYYWEWVEDCLGRSKTVLTSAGVYDAVYASLFVYDRNANIFRSFLESWSPNTNTLIVSAGELSISLWDLRSICGLPIEGIFYDEVVPSAKELTGVTESDKPYLPQSCQYLFAAFHHLRQNSKKRDKVDIEAWVRFWYIGPGKYHRASKNKSCKSKYPSGVIGSPLPWSTTDDDPFSTLGVEEELEKETYIAALISCWLCVFILPLGNSIRPSTFKMASLIATGKVISLAIPVLASIYRGLRGISHSVCPGRCKAYLPAHYIYAWLGRYFRTHSFNGPQSNGPLMVRLSGEGAAVSFEESYARDLICHGKHIVWHASAMKNDKDSLLIDNGNLSSSYFSYFVSLRSAYLSFRQDERCIVESYNPHRFSRQFGFHQDIPGGLVEDPRNGSLEDLYKFFRACLLHKSQSSLLIPACASNFGGRVTRRYEEWWSQFRKEYFSIGDTTMAETLVDPNKVASIKPPPKKIPKLRIVHGPSKNGDSQCNGKLASDVHAKGELNTLEASKANGRRLPSVVVTNVNPISNGPTKNDINISKGSDRKRSSVQVEIPLMIDDQTHLEHTNIDSDECWKHKQKKSKSDAPPQNNLVETTKVLFIL